MIEASRNKSGLAPLVVGVNCGDGKYFAIKRTYSQLPRKENAIAVITRWGIKRLAGSIYIVVDDVLLICNT